MLVVPVPELPMPEEKNVSGKPPRQSCRAPPARAALGRTLSTEVDMGFIHGVQVRKRAEGCRRPLAGWRCSC